MKITCPYFTNKFFLRRLGSALLVTTLLQSFALSIHAQTLTHRYSFTSDASDSVGGANGTLEGNATISGGQVVMDGVNSWVLLPPGLLNGYTAITVETWVTWQGPGSTGVGGAYQRIFDFGNTDQAPGVPSPGGDQYDSVTLVANDANGALSFWSLDTRWYGSIEDQVVEDLSTNVQHQVVWTYDGVTSTVYVDGAALSVLSPLPVPYDFVDDTNIWFGQSLSANDGHFWGSMNEIRIYNGALSPLQVALDAAAGPNTLAGSNPGALQTLTLTVSSNNTSVSTMANYASATDVNVTSQATYTSSDPTVLSVDTLGNIYPFTAGSSTITASYGGQTATQLVTITAPPAPTMTHRYSFTSDASDSVGSANGVLFGDATVSGGALQLPDGSGYVALPAGLFDTTYKSISVEFWANIPRTADGTGQTIWSFGNTDGNACRMRAKSAAANLWFDGYGRSAENLKPGPLCGNVHVVGIWDPPGNQLSVYINGNVEVYGPYYGYNLGDNTGANDLVNILGAYIDGSDGMGGGATVDEFRIYNGALSPIQVRTSLASGPTNAIINAGPILSVSVTTRTNFIVGTFQDPVVTGNSATVSNINLTALLKGKNLTPFEAVTFASSDPTIVAVTALGQIQAVGVGSATLTASFQGVSNTCPVSTIAPQPLLLEHRYSFASTASDSVSGANGIAMGGATVSNGLILTGNSVTRGAYLAMPRDTVQGYTSMTIEMWVTEIPTPAYSRLWSFGNYSAGGGDASGILLFNTYAGNEGLDLNCNPNVALDTVFGYDNMPIGDDYSPTNGVLTYVAAGIDAVNHLGFIYTNGVLGAVQTFEHNVSEIDMQRVTFGKSLSTSDAYVDGIISEVRIYYGALQANQVASNYAAGPGTVGILSGPAHVTDQPVPLTVFVGQSATFSVGAIGTPTLTYQWKKGGTPIPGATGATYTITNATYTNAGSYSVTVNNGTSDSSTAVQLTVLPLATFANLTNGLVIHLPFDGSFADTSGNSNNATPVGTPVFVPGKIGSHALQVNSDKVNAIFNAALVPAPFNYTSAGSPATLHFDATTSWSVSLWVKYTGYPQDLPMIGNSVNSTFNPGWVITDNDGRPEFTLDDTINTLDSSDGPSYFVPTAPPTDNGQWHHLAMTIDRTAQLLTFYLDGVQVEVKSVAALGSVDDSGSGLGIGQDPTGGYVGFNGPTAMYAIDDVGIWSRALSATEAESIYYTGQAGTSFDTFGPESLALIQSTGGVWQIIWQAGTLESASTLTGPWTPVAGATAPLYTFTPGAGNLFYRVKL